MKHRHPSQNNNCERGKLSLADQAFTAFAKSPPLLGLGRKKEKIRALLVKVDESWAGVVLKKKRLGEARL